MRYLLNFLLFFSTLLICIITLEIYVRIFDPQKLIYYNNDLWINDYNGLGHKHAPNLITKINTGGAGLVNYRTDKNGFRINLDDDAAQNIDKRILILGDSFIEAIQVENKDSIPELLRKKLKLYDNLKIKYDNTAVAAYGLNHYYLIAKEQLFKKEYDLGIVFLSIANDLEIERIRESFDPWSYTHPKRFKMLNKINKEEIIEKILYPINDFFEVRSHLFLFSKYKLRNILVKYGLAYSSSSNIFYINEKNTINIDKAMKLSVLIQDEFTKYNTPLIFVFVPTIYQVEQYAFDQLIKNKKIDKDEIDINLPNKLLSKRFYKNNLIFYDPLKHMQNISSKNIKLYEPIDKHLNKYGHRVVSEFLHSELKIVLENFKKK